MTTPSGFIQRPKARSVAEATSFDAHDRIASIAKNALQTYIESFMNTDGLNRAFAKAIAPAVLQYVTDKSLQDRKNDPKYKPTQLARMYNDIATRTPAIMIIDAGVDWIEPGLGGGLEKVTMLNGKWQGWYRVLANVPVTVAVVANDPETVGVLQNFLSICFMQLRVIAGGSLMSARQPGENWEVRVPLTFPESSAAPEAVGEDATDAIWAATIELELQAEDLFAVEKDITTHVVDGGVVGDADLATTFKPTIDAPNTVRLRDGSFLISVSRLGLTHRIAIDQPRIATFNPESMTITPHRSGSFRLIVYDTEKRSSQASTPWVHAEVAAKSITVTL